jgi:hypothetical protein
MIMKNRRLIFLVVTIVAIMLLVVWYTKKPVEQSSQPAHDETNIVASSLAKSATIKTSPFPAISPVHSDTLAQGVVPVPNPAPSPSDKKGEQIKDELAALNDVPIVFYGKIEDQFGDPVGGVKITGGIRVYNATRSTMRRISTESDANGLFQLNGGNGESLGVMPEKSGYALGTTNTMFNYSAFYPKSQHVADSNAPVIFKMWKLQGVEPLVKIDQSYKISFMNEPLFFDLVAGKAVKSGGDIKIYVKRPPGNISGLNRQDWSIDIEAIDGGLVDTSMAEARVTYAAPSDGYQPSETLKASTNEHGLEFIEKMFFLKSRNGQVYSKILLSFRINGTPNEQMSINFRGIVNANASRNWEGDPNTMKSK